MTTTTIAIVRGADLNILLGAFLAKHAEMGKEEVDGVRFVLVEFAKDAPEGSMVFGPETDGLELDAAGEGFQVVVDLIMDSDPRTQELADVVTGLWLRPGNPNNAWATTMRLFRGIQSRISDIFTKSGAAETVSIEDAVKVISLTGLIQSQAHLVLQELQRDWGEVKDLTLDARKELLKEAAGQVDRNIGWQIGKAFEAVQKAKKAAAAKAAAAKTAAPAPVPVTAPPAPVAEAPAAVPEAPAAAPVEEQAQAAVA